MYVYCTILFTAFLTNIKIYAQETESLLALLDTHHEATEQKTGAVTNYLAYAIIEKNTPIIVNGAVFHNFLLLQKKNNDLLDQLKYPTIQTLVTAVYESKKQTEKYTKDRLTYLAHERSRWYNSIAEKDLDINETLIENAGHAFFSLIPLEPITTAINKAEYQIVPVLNQFLEILQNQFSDFFKTYKAHSADELDALVKNYNHLLKVHVQELEELKKILYKNIELIVEAHNLLTEYTFEYTYRFAEFKTNEWNMYFQKENDIYLLLPTTVTSKNIRPKDIPRSEWYSHNSLFSMITKNSIESQGLYSLYQRTHISPLANIDQFFELKDGIYKKPLDLFIIGHGSSQETGAAYSRRILYEQKRIAITLQIIQALISRCEAELMNITQKSLDELVDALTKNQLISPQQYDAIAYETNKIFIDQQHEQRKNPLDPRPEDVELFLQKQLTQLQKTDLDYSFYWLFLTNLMQRYQRASDTIDALNLENLSPNELVPASAHLAGLKVKQLQSFIDQSVSTKRLKTLFFLTCFGGGSNRLIFESIAKQLNQDKEHFVACGVGALTDAAVPSLIPTLAMFVINNDGSVAFKPPFSFKTFFEKKFSPNGLAAITVGQKYPVNSSVNEYFHGVADLPWTYNQKTKRLELVNLKNQLLDLNSEKLDELTKSKTKDITTLEQKVVMLHPENIELSITLNPEDQLLPLLCSAQTKTEARHTISELSLPNHTLEEFMQQSIGHLRQAKTYKFTIEKLHCRGLTTKKKNTVLLKNVAIESSFKERYPEENKSRPTENDLILWDINIGELPVGVSAPTKLYCRDYFNQDKQRIFTQLFKK